MQRYAERHAHGKVQRDSGGNRQLSREKNQMDRITLRARRIFADRCRTEAQHFLSGEEIWLTARVLCTAVHLEQPW